MCLGGATLLGALVSARIVQAVGEPAVPLDDSYIHFNYARSFARLEPFSYAPGAPPSSGATSLGWVLALSLGWLVGFRELSIIWVAWALGWLCLGLLAWDTLRVARRFARPAIAWTAPLMVLCFAPHSWFAASAMEVIPLAWLLMRSARLCLDYAEAEPALRRAAPALITCTAAAITRPEGVLAAGWVCLTLSIYGGRARRLAPLALVGPFVSPAVNWLLTGQALSATAQAKLLSTGPYATSDTLWQAQLHNLKIFFNTLLNGELWAQGVIPPGHAWLPVVAVLALPLAARRRPLAWVVILTFALGALLPTSYWTFLVNRLRYLWPFAAAWLIALVGLCELVARGLAWLAARPLLARRLPGWVATRGAALTGVALGIWLAWSLARGYPDALRDLVVSARGVHAQQVSLARWAKATLPPGATIGVNDAGAIAYLSDHPTFDLVGLTTPGEARAWRAGPGPRFERYEHEVELPPYLILYPSWLQVEPVLGRELTRRSVYYATILGAPEMVAYETRRDLLRSGEAPPGPGSLLDRLDVADLTSEAAHGYELFFAHEGTSDVRVHGQRADGARTHRRQERFQLELAPGGRLWLRAGAEAPLALSVRVAGREVGRFALSGVPWEEVHLTLPSDLPRGRAEVELTSEPAAWFATLHYWSLE